MLNKKAFNKISHYAVGNTYVQKGGRGESLELAMEEALYN